MIRFIPNNAQAIGSRSNQQDSFGFSDLNNGAFVEHGGFVAMVADGMGGLSHGDAASRIAVKTFLDTYATKLIGETIPEALQRALKAANDAVFEHAVAVGSPGDVGTTLIAVALLQEGLYWISVGDSAIYLHRNGILTLLTTSHIYAHTLDARLARGEITRDQAMSDPQREALTSYVGASEIKEIDHNIRPFPLQSGDVILLASDGLFKTLPEAMIAATVAGGADKAADLLVRKTLECRREHQDNVTVCMVRIEKDAPRGASVETSDVVTWTPPRGQAAVATTQTDAPLLETVEMPAPSVTPVPRVTEVQAAPPLPPPPAAPSKTRTANSRLAAMLVACVVFALAASFLVWKMFLARPVQQAGQPASEAVPKGETQPGAADPQSVAPPANQDPASMPAKSGETPTKANGPADPPSRPK